MFHERAFRLAELTEVNTGVNTEVDQELKPRLSAIFDRKLSGLLSDVLVAL